MSEEVINNAIDDEMEKDPREEIQRIIFQTLKNKIKGHIFVKVEEKNDDVSVDSVFVSVICYGIKYDYRLGLEGKTYEMVSTNGDYAKTLALMIFDNYKQFIMNKIFINEKSQRDYRKNK